MSDIKVSLFASAVRHDLWNSLIESLNATIISYEIVFCGNKAKEPGWSFYHLKHIKTENIKPAQCYEIARRHCQGETVVWIADDCEFPKDIIGKAYKYWKSQNNKKLILSLQTKESGYGTKEPTLFDMTKHCFYGGDSETPLMAPIGMMSRKFLDELGGFDRRYIGGQYENDLVMRAYQNGAKVEIFGDENNYVEIDHLRKSFAIGESTNEEDYLQRPFAKNYQHDRKILQESWTTFDMHEAIAHYSSGGEYKRLRKMSPIQLDKFEPYSDEDILTKSQSYKGHWE